MDKLSQCSKMIFPQIFSGPGPIRSPCNVKECFVVANSEPSNNLPADEHVAVIGGGPAGLMAAEVLSAAGCSVTVYDRMPTLGRKFLLAGRGGLNLTHSEDRGDFLLRYGSAAESLRPYLEAFPPGALAAWCDGLGVTMFIGSSGRVFPGSFKSSPLLRAWLRRLDEQGVRFKARHTWTDWDEAGTLTFQTAAAGVLRVTPMATVLALGGASWPRLGSDGRWLSILARAGIATADLHPANCGCEINWSPIFRERFEGAPLKRIAVTCGDTTVRGEAMITKKGLEGGAVYALSALVRASLSRGLRETSLFLSAELGASRERWTWGRLHHVRFAPLWPGAWRGEPGALGPFELAGAGDTIAVSEYATLGDGFDAEVVAGYRLLVDAGNLDQALTAFAPGQSEHAGHPHATDALERWRLGKPNLLSTSDPVIEDGAVQSLRLEPAP